MNAVIQRALKTEIAAASNALREELQFGFERLFKEAHNRFKSNIELADAMILRLSQARARVFDAQSALLDWSDPTVAAK